jgi:hypothetical protein
MRMSVKAMTVSTLVSGMEMIQNIPSYMPSIVTAARGHRRMDSHNDGGFPKQNPAVVNWSGLMRTPANADVAGAGGFEPPHGGIKIRQDLQ